MLEKIKKFTGFLLILFFVVALFITVLTIWDVVSNEVAKEAFIKVAYTFGAIFIVSLLVMYFTKTKE